MPSTPTPAGVRCPNCGSPATQRFGPGMLGFLFFLSGSCLLWIPVLGWIAAPFAFLIALGLWVKALLPSKTVTFQCQICKQGFTVDKAVLASLPAVSSTKACPFCAEEIQATAIVCKHCRRDLSGAPARMP